MMLLGTKIDKDSLTKHALGTGCESGCAGENHDILVCYYVKVANWWMIHDKIASSSLLPRENFSPSSWEERIPENSCLDIQTDRPERKVSLNCSKSLASRDQDFLFHFLPFHRFSVVHSQ